ncbi:MAG: magnesium/cobalt transporter CorA [Armatimonadetes bacterium]|nr:magnesium/cobalt transporter CorA [Armatimonadota bacterium]
MAKRRAKRATAVIPAHRPVEFGTPPGTLLAPPGALSTTVGVICYGEAGIEEFAVADPSELTPLREKPSVLWVDVHGLGDEDFIKQIGDVFGLHDLALEDVLNLHQRAKIEYYDDHYFIVVHAVDYKETLVVEQLSLFLGSNYVITFQPRKIHCLDPLRERLRKRKDKIYLNGSDFLAYSILDAVIDGYFPVLEKYGEIIEDAEERIVAKPTPESLAGIHDVRRELLSLRRIMWPLRDALNSLYRDETNLITSETLPYLRDCHDHAVRIIDLLEIYRELGADLQDIYLSSVSNRINEVMKVLTIITTIFIPLSFIASVYGMNFDHMPELRKESGYFIVLGVMGFIGLALLFYFWKRGWLTKDDFDPKNH